MQLAILAVLLCCWALQPALAQQANGTITGTVQDGTGAVIPGVTVTLSSVGLVGGNQTAITDERGVYRFTRLVPSTYSVKGELPGFRPAALNGIIVNADVTVRADLTMVVGNITDSVTVTGESPLLDTTSALTQAVLDRSTLDTLQSGHDVWSIARAVPAVILSKYDVGGSESFQQSGLLVHGSPASENKYAIDGMDISWAGGSGGSAMVYINTGMFQEANYQVGNITAESEKGGVVMNMVTKTGTNDLHASFSFTGASTGMNFDNLNATQRANLLVTVPAAVKAANPNLVPNGKILSLFDANATISGPIFKDQLWFTTSGKLNALNQYVVGSYNPDGSLPVDDNRIKDGSFKVSWQMTAKSQLHFFFERNYTSRYHRRTTTFSDDASSRVQGNPVGVYQLKWSGTPTPRIVIDLMASTQAGTSDYTPQDVAKPGCIPHNDLGTSTLTLCNPTYALGPTYKAASNAAVSYFAGSHEVKVGYQFGRNTLATKSWSLSHYPSGLVANFRNGNAESATLYSTPSYARGYFQDNAVYAQDKWTVNRRLTINYGLRLQMTNGWVPAECQEATPWVKAQCFDKISDVPNWKDVAPRLSMVYDVFGNGKTAIKLSANHYNVSIGVGYQNVVNPVSIATNLVDWTDPNKDGIPQLAELGAGSGFNFGTTNQYVKGIKRPTSDEYSAGVQQELPFGVVLSATYFHRDNWRNIERSNVAVPYDSGYTPITVAIPPRPAVGFEGQTVTIYNILPSLRSAISNVYQNRSDLGTYYNGVDLNVNKRLSNRWMVMGGVSLSSFRTRKGLNLNDPNQNAFLGNPVSGSVPRSFKLTGLYQLPFGISLSGNTQYFAGKPEPHTYTITRTLVPSLTNTSISVPLAAFGDYHLPATNITDFAVRKELKVGESARFAPTLEVFNIFNSGATQSRITDLSQSFGQVTTVLRGRMIRAGFSVNY
jgi:hypothetical protein